MNRGERQGIMLCLRNVFAMWRSTKAEKTPSAVVVAEGVFWSQPFLLLPKINIFPIF